MMIQMKSFGKIWNNAIQLMEEVVRQFLFSMLDDPFRIHLKMECRKDSILLSFDYGGQPLDTAAMIREKSKSLLNQDGSENDLFFSAKVILGFSKEIMYSRQKGELVNHLEIQVSESARK